jgi:uncharacterized protein YdhG (YjbR/CyaY superfamily)
MRYEADSIEDYFAQVPDERKPAINRLWETIRDNIPEGFAEQMSYGFPGFVVPHAIYPSGYHCDPKEALPFLSIASQKHFIAMYHMGLYAKPDLLIWFTDNYPNHSKTKLDMGKSCIRFKKRNQIPFELIGKLVSKMTVEDWINIYESEIKK